MTQTNIKPLLYDRNSYLRLEETIARLRIGDFQGLDVLHLIEELEIMAGRDRAEIESCLGVLLAHFLKRLHVDSAGYTKTTQLRDERENKVPII